MIRGLRGEGTYQTRARKRRKSLPVNQIRAQRSGSDLERKKEGADMELSRPLTETAEAAWSELLLTWARRVLSFRASTEKKESGAQRRLLSP